MSKSTKTTPSHFCASSYRFTDIKLLNLLPSKCISRSRSTTLAMTTFDCKCQNPRKTQFCVSCHRCRYMNLISFLFKKGGQDHEVQFFALKPFYGKYQNKKDCHAFLHQLSYFRCIFI